MMAINLQARFKLYRSYLFLAAFLLLCVENGRTQENKIIHKEKTLPLDSLVRYGKLDNGFTYYLRKNNVPSNRIELNMVVKAGMYHEDEDQLEYAHLLEHILAKGTKNFPGLDDKFSGPGQNKGAQTGNRFTWYYASIPSTHKSFYQDGIKVLRDWSSGIYLNQKSIDVERAAVLGEMRTTDPYREWKSRIIHKKILENTGFRVFSLNRKKTSIRDFNPNSFFRFYQDWYRPDLQAAIIVGDIDLDSTELEIKRSFSDLKLPKTKKNAQARVNDHTFKLDGKNRFLSVLDSVRSDLRLAIVPKQANYSYNPKTKLAYKFFLLQELYWLLVERKQDQFKQQLHPPYSYLNFNYNRNLLGGGQILASKMEIAFETDDSKDIKTHLKNAMLAWRQMHMGITSSDLKKAKKLLLQKFIEGKSYSSAKWVGRLKDHFVKGSAAPHPEIELELVSKILQEVSLMEMKAILAEKATLTKNTDFIFFSGKLKNIPSDKKLRKWLREINNKEVAPLKPLPPPIHSLTKAAGIPDKLNNFDYERKEDMIGITTIKLKNGIKLVLKPTKPRTENFKNTISFRAFRPNRTSLTKRKEYLATKIYPELIKYNGAGPYNKIELERFKREKQLNINFRHTKDLQLITGSTKQQSLEELFNLLYLYVAHPRKDSIGFSSWKSHKRVQLSGFGLRGSTHFIKNEIQKKWHPQVPKIELKDLEKITEKEILNASYGWSDFSEYTFIITGDFNEDELISRIIRQLSNFPVPKKIFTEKGIDLKFPMEQIEDTLYFNNIDQAFVNLYFPVKASRNLKTQIELRLLSRALGDRIRKRLRDGCYAPIGNGDWFDANNGIFAFTIQFNSELGNEEKMIQYAREEFRALKEKGVEWEWLEKNIAKEIKGFEGRFSRFGYSNFWPEYLQSKLVTEENYVQDILQYGTLLDHFISLEDINNAAKKYLTEQNMQKFVSFPENMKHLN